MLSDYLHDIQKLSLILSGGIMVLYLCKIMSLCCEMHASVFWGKVVGIHTLL